MVVFVGVRGVVMSRALGGPCQVVVQQARLVVVLTATQLGQGTPLLGGGGGGGGAALGGQAQQPGPVGGLQINNNQIIITTKYKT